MLATGTSVTTPLAKAVAESVSRTSSASGPFFASSVVPFGSASQATRRVPVAELRLR